MNKSIGNCEFPDKLKKAEVSPIFKNELTRRNFRSISVLSTFSKVFERQISQQVTPFAKTKISRLLCGFREGHSPQHALFRLKIVATAWMMGASSVWYLWICLRLLIAYLMIF